MREQDVPAVHAVQCAAYPPAYHEAERVLAARCQIGAGNCFVAADAGEVSAYLIAYPWRGAPPPLHVEAAGVAGCDHLFVHDLAVHPAARGRRLADALLDALLTVGREAAFPTLRLVAVGRARTFWAARGFLPRPEIELDPGYGDAVAMERARRA